jgi:hypothetical protein
LEQVWKFCSAIYSTRNVSRPPRSKSRLLRRIVWTQAFNCDWCFECMYGSDDAPCFAFAWRKGKKDLGTLIKCVEGGWSYVATKRSKLDVKQPDTRINHLGISVRAIDTTNRCHPSLGPKPRLANHIGNLSRKQAQSRSNHLSLTGNKYHQLHQRISQLVPLPPKPYFSF